jgi:hypothetical protein
MTPPLPIDCPAGRALPCYSVAVSDAPDLNERPEPPEPPPSLPTYFGGYALVFAAVVGLAMLLVLAAKCLR